MRIFLTKWFARFARRERVSTSDLIRLLRRAESGIVDAELGGGLLKLRLPRVGRGRCGGYRVLVVFRAGDLAFCIYGYAKSEKPDLAPNEVLEYKKAAVDFLALSEEIIVQLLTDGKLVEIVPDGEASEK